MSNTICVTKISSITASEVAAHMYSIELSSGDEQILISGQADDVTLVDKITRVHGDLMDSMYSLIKIVLGDDYEPPVGLYTFDINSTLELFYTFVRNLGFNNTVTGIDLTGTSLSSIGKLRFITDRFFPIFTRVQNHIMTSDTATACPQNDQGRLLYVHVENCIFDAIFTYN